jgi:hypothetical protein
MSVATAVADLPEPKRTGLSIFILANEPGKLTAKAIKECATTMKKWSGLQMPLMAKHQSQRNIARALVRLWSQVEDTYPEDAYAAAAMFIYRGVHEEPWGAQEKLTLWFQALGGDTYFTDDAQGGSLGGINWTAVVEYLITEVACETCPIAQLPKQQLRSDLSQGQGGPLGMPCRVGQDAHSASSTSLSRSGQVLDRDGHFDFAQRRLEDKYETAQAAPTQPTSTGTVRLEPYQDSRRQVIHDTLARLEDPHSLAGQAAYKTLVVYTGERNAGLIQAAVNQHTATAVQEATAATADLVAQYRDQEMGDDAVLAAFQSGEAAAAIREASATPLSDEQLSAVADMVLLPQRRLTRT